MKKIALILFIILISQLGMAQELTTAPNEETIYSAATIEVMPQFPGGPDEFRFYVSKNYKTPYVDKPLKGMIVVEFVIENDGAVGDVRVIRDLGFGTGEEAVRLMKDCPKWEPGIQNGKPVRTRYVFPIALDIKIN